MERYKHLNTYLKEKFGERTLKIPVDGGFTCPNRDGKVGYGGCIFCTERGSGEHLKTKQIPIQIKEHLESYRGKRANKFIVYFQNFTNTYDTIENLKAKYDSSLIDDRIVGIDIATRPDCINEEVCKLLQSYSSVNTEMSLSKIGSKASIKNETNIKDKSYAVTVELGLQTSNEEIAKQINRGYSLDVFTNAVKLLNNYNVEVVVHMMIGLPNETMQDIENTVKYINSLNIQGIKIHSTYVAKGTVLEKMYKEGKYEPLTLEEYLDKLLYVITHLRQDIIIHRISGDAPKNLLVAPDWNLHKKWVLNGLDKMMRKQNRFQGDTKIL